ncbi:MAG: hypothetical protein ABIQ70_00795 [Dokdonella sp.]
MQSIRRLEYGRLPLEQEVVADGSMALTRIAPVASSFLIVRIDVDGKERLITR